MPAPLEFEDEPPTRGRFNPPVTVRNLWVTQFTAVLTAILIAQIINLIVGYLLYRNIMARVSEAMNKPAAGEVRAH